jgi:TPR repeat protein
VRTTRATWPRRCTCCAGAGHAASQALLGFILDRADFAAEAVPLYRAAAAQDDADAHAGLANLYLLGRGIAKDEKQALAHFSKAAELGNAAAIEVMALAYRNGSFGLAPDAVQAARWQARGAELRQSRAASAAPAGP